MNIFDKIMKAICSYSTQKLTDELEELKFELSECNAQKAILKDKLKICKDESSSQVRVLSQEILELEKEIDDLEKEIDKSNKTIKDVSLKDYFEEKTEYYEWKKGERVKLRETLKNFSKDEEYLSKYKAWLDEIGVKNYNNPQTQVYMTVNAVHDYVNDGDDYDKDIESFKVSEHWLSPQEALDYYVEQDNQGDCEDKSALLYGAIVTKLLENGWGEHTWRLQRVDVIIQGVGGHALLAWLKDDLVWSPIESTYAYRTFKENWRRDADIFKSMYAKIWHIFNEDSEYKLK